MTSLWTPRPRARGALGERRIPDETGVLEKISALKGERVSLFGGHRV